MDCLILKIKALQCFEKSVTSSWKGVTSQKNRIWTTPPSDPQISQNVAVSEIKTNFFHPLLTSTYFGFFTDTLTISVPSVVLLIVNVGHGYTVDTVTGMTLGIIWTTIKFRIVSLPDENLLKPDTVQPKVAVFKFNQWKSILIFSSI